MAAIPSRSTKARPIFTTDHGVARVLKGQGRGQFIQADKRRDRTRVLKFLVMGAIRKNRRHYGIVGFLPVDIR
jgi:hypothetical protein